MKGICKADYENIQTYLDVLCEFLLIDDEHKPMRVKWVLGKETLALSARNKKILALNNYTYDERIYNFNSPLNVDGGCSLLEKLFDYHKKLQNYSMLSLKTILSLCNSDEYIRNYIYSLSSPCLTMSRYSNFFQRLIDKYLKDAQVSYSYYSHGFNKE